MPETCVTCVFCSAVKSMCIVDHDYDRATNKWSCSRCGSFTWVPDTDLPTKRDIGNHERNGDSRPE